MKTIVTTPKNDHIHIDDLLWENLQQSEIIVGFSEERGLLMLIKVIGTGRYAVLMPNDGVVLQRDMSFKEAVHYIYRYCVEDSLGIIKGLEELLEFEKKWEKFRV